MPDRRWIAAAALLMLAGCSTGAPMDATTSANNSSAIKSTSIHPTAPTSTPRTTPATTSTTPPASRTAAQVFAAMSEAQRVGQLLMVDCPSGYVADATVAAITRDGVGSVILDGTSDKSVSQTAAITAALQQSAPASVQLFVSTDQEGGLVQRLQGPGFTRIPSAVDQGQTDPVDLRTATAAWATQLKAAGVNVDLGPVLDTVPTGGGSNPPIGDLDREYGSTPAVVTSHGLAVLSGLTDAGVDATVKHFPGLGRVAGNTDTTSGVKDTITTRIDPYLAPFAAAIKAGVPFVMMSTAIYTRIDPNNPAAFSRTILTGLLRNTLGFTGVVISDDLGAAAQVAYLSPGQRAVAFVAAGGDMVLTVDATLAPEMTAALLTKANADPAFKALVDAAARRVLQAKQARGLLH
ncbi:MAG: glycoside hydrolase family 3 N-terminal domain-containing protein [Jatrophihabitantaceae bacterium]